MLKATDFRVGNTIQYIDVGQDWKDNKVTVDDIAWAASHNDSFNVRFRPILLTPMIMLKYGFRKCSCGGYDGPLHLRRYDNEGVLRYNYTTTILYLHQLQNLYFALTGEELKIEP